MKLFSRKKEKIHPEAVTESHIKLEEEKYEKGEIENPEEHEQEEREAKEIENPEEHEQEEKDEKFPKTDVDNNYIWYPPEGWSEDESIDEDWRMNQYGAILKENNIKKNKKYKWRMDGGCGKWYGKLVDIKYISGWGMRLYFVDVWYRKSGGSDGFRCFEWDRMVGKKDGEFFYFNGKRTNDTFYVFLHQTNPKSFKLSNRTYPPSDSDELPHNRSVYLSRHNIQLHQKALNPDLMDEEIEKIRGGRKKTKRKRTRRKRRKRTRRKGRKRTKRKRRRKGGKKTRRRKKQIGCRKN
jgi:hypothetical protein